MDSLFNELILVYEGIWSLTNITFKQWKEGTTMAHFHIITLCDVDELCKGSNKCKSDVAN